VFWVCGELCQREEDNIVSFDLEQQGECSEYSFHLSLVDSSHVVADGL
jgi:hypothetical protein